MGLDALLYTSGHIPTVHGIRWCCWVAVCCPDLSTQLLCTHLGGNRWAFTYMACCSEVPHVWTHCRHNRSTSESSTHVLLCRRGHCWPHFQAWQQGAQAGCCQGHLVSRKESASLAVSLLPWPARAIEDGPPGPLRCRWWMDKALPIIIGNRSTKFYTRSIQNCKPFFWRLY